MRRILASTVLAFIIGSTSVAVGSAIKSWSSGEVLTSSDLNANFAHIHNTMVGGHGARLVNADISSSAAISHTKLASPSLVPKVWATTPSGSCTPGPCTIAGTGFSGITGVDAGSYVATFSSNRGPGTYGVLVTPKNTLGIGCSVELSASQTSFQFDCVDSSGSGTNTGFTVMILDTVD